MQIDDDGGTVILGGVGAAKVTEGLKKEAKKFVVIGAGGGAQQFFQAFETFILVNIPRKTASSLQVQVLSPWTCR
jgi:hypothetical protein